MSIARFPAALLATFAALALAAASSDAAVINVPLPLPSGCQDIVVIQVNCKPTTGKPICKDAALQPTRSNLAKVRAATLCLLNLERTSRRLPKLKNNVKLGRAAKSYAGRMVREHFFSHVAPNGSTLDTRIRQASYLSTKPRRWYIGENLAYATRHESQPAQIVYSWMHSAGHRANLLHNRYREIGIGTVIGTPTTTWGATYVAEFGRRIR